MRPLLRSLAPKVYQPCVGVTANLRRAGLAKILLCRLDKQGAERGAVSGVLLQAVNDCFSRRGIRGRAKRERQLATLLSHFAPALRTAALGPSVDTTKWGIPISPARYAAHKHPKVRAWLARHPRWTIHFGEWTSFLYLVTPSAPESTSCGLHLHWSKMGPEVCFR